jgi:hypothetical protein
MITRGEIGAIVDGGVADTWTANNAILSAQDAARVAAYKAEDTSDSIGSNTLTNVGATFTSGKHNDAFTLGSNKHLFAANASAWDFAGGAFMIRTWVRQSSSPTVPRILVHDDVDGTRGWLLLTLSGPVTFGAFNGVTNRQLDGTSLTNGVYRDIVVIRYANTMALYEDGSEVDTVDVTGFTISNPSVGMFVGSDEDGGNGWSDQIDEVTIWKGHGITNKTESDAFIGNDGLYNSGTGAFLI